MDGLESERVLLTVGGGTLETRKKGKAERLYIILVHMQGLSRRCFPVYGIARHGIGKLC